VESKVRGTPARSTLKRLVVERNGRVTPARSMLKRLVVERNGRVTPARSTRQNNRPTSSAEARQDSER